MHRHRFYVHIGYENQHNSTAGPTPIHGKIKSLHEGLRLEYQYPQSEECSEAGKSVHVTLKRRYSEMHR